MKNTTPKLTEKLIKEISSILSQGQYIEFAVAQVGISKDTFYRWLRQGKGDKPTKLTKKLSDAVRYALAISEKEHLKIIDAHAQGLNPTYEYEVVRDSDGTILKDKEGNPYLQVSKDAKGNPIYRFHEIKADWKAAAWKLERRFPNRWGRVSNLSGHDNLLQIDEFEIKSDFMFKDIELDLEHESKTLKEYLKELK